MVCDDWGKDEKQIAELQENQFGEEFKSKITLEQWNLFALRQMGRNDYTGTR